MRPRWGTALENERRYVRRNQGAPEQAEAAKGECCVYVQERAATEVKPHCGSVQKWTPSKGLLPN